MVVLRLIKFGGSPRPEIIAHVAPTHKHRQFRFPSGIFLDAEYWDTQQEYCKAIHPAHKSINELIDRFRDSVIDAYTIIMKNREPIENIVDYVIHQQIDETLAAPMRKAQRSIQKLTLAYMNEISKTNISWTKIDLARRTLYTLVKLVGNDRVDVCLSPEKIMLYMGHIKHGKFGQYSNWTVKGIMRELRQFLLYCGELGIYNTKHSLEVLDSYGKYFAPKEKTKYSLGMEHIHALLELPNLYKEEKYVRDLLVFVCMTGMRISDALNLKLKDIHTMKLDDGSLIEYAEIVHIKKNRRTMHPINGLASEAITRWARSDENLKIFEFERPYELRRINEKIKSLLNMTGLCNYLVPVNKYILGKEVRTTMPFKDVFSSHSGRISFSAMFIEGGGNIKVLQSILDHKNLATTMKYIPDKSKEEAILDSGKVVQSFLTSK
jgi:integrase